MSYLRLLLVTGMSIALVRPVIAQHGPDWTAPKATPVVATPAPAIDPSPVQPGGIYIPPGGIFEKTHTLTTDNGGTSDDATAGAQSGKIRTLGGGKTDAKADMGAPKVKTPGGAGADGGETGGQGSANPAPPAGAHLWGLLIAGVLLILAGLAMQLLPKFIPALSTFAPDPKIPPAMELGGGILCYAAFNPGIFLWLVLGLVAVLCGPMILHALQEARKNAVAAAENAAEKQKTAAADAEAAAHKSALSETLEATLTDNPQAKTALLAHLDKRAAAPDKSVILSTISADGLSLS